jgi:hypothetical protein
VLSGFSQIQIGFENLLKNGFEKLEKEKKWKISSSRFRPNSAAARLLPRPPSVLLGRAQASARGLLSQPPPRFSSESPTCGSRLSATVFTFLSSSSGRTPPSPSSPIR